MNAFDDRCTPTAGRNAGFTRFGIGMSNCDRDVRVRAGEYPRHVEAARREIWPELRAQASGWSQAFATSGIVSASVANSRACGEERPIVGSLERPLELRFDGSDVVDGRVPLDVYTGVLSALQRAAVGAVEEALGLPPKRGRRPSSVLRLARLDFVSAGRGSVRVVTAPSEMADTVGREAWERLVGGVVTGEDLPERARKAVIEMLKHLNGGVSQLTLTPLWPSAGVSRTYSAGDASRFAPPQQPTAPATTRTAWGRLFAADWNRGTAEVHSPDGVVEHISFSVDHANTVQDAVRRFVTVIGQEVTERGRTRLEVGEIMIDHASDDSWFWRPPTVEERISQQGTRPFRPDDPEYAPVEFDVDEFLAGVRADR